VARRIVFPVTVGAVVGGAVWALERGVSGTVVTAVAFGVSALLVGTLERLLPYRPDWNRPHGDVLVDATYLGLTGLSQGVAQVLVAAVVVQLVACMAWAGVTPRWPVGWPLVAQLALASVHTEFFDYWAHRVMHQVPALWRVHQLHHSAPRLYWLNAARAHPVEMVFRGAVAMLPLAVLQPDPRLVALLAVVNIVVGFFQHANVDFRLGPLSYAFSVGALHRWHHSRLPPEADRNYGNNFMWWDVVFGTRFLPADRDQPAALGFEDVERYPRRLAAQLVAPFRTAPVRSVAHQ
jgi:sterol desaturase/sphingolipid hydroxylase (fatty acid hydroxylase superfamily)